MGRLGCFFRHSRGNNEDRDDSNQDQEELKNWLNVYQDVDGG